MDPSEHCVRAIREVGGPKTNARMGRGDPPEVTEGLKTRGCLHGVAAVYEKAEALGPHLVSS